MGTSGWEGRQLPRKLFSRCEEGKKSTLNPKLSEASANVTAETLRPDQEAERLNDRGR